MNKLTINDLLEPLNKSKQIKQQEVSKFIQKVVNDREKKINILSKQKQQMIRRQSNYQITKQDMDKWVGIIKINRQKQSLNLQQKDINNYNVNFYSSKPINSFHKTIQNKLSSMNIQNQKVVLKYQDQILEKLNPQQAKARLIEARKYRTAIFQQEKKRKRISKIKSKLYHRIKARKRIREQQKKMGEMNEVDRNKYIQNLTKKRIKQRLTLRHNTKSKHIKNLLRFNKNQKNTIQLSINSINDIRHQQMSKINQNLSNQQLSEEYHDENFRQQGMKDLEAQLQNIQKQEANVRNDNEDENGVDDQLKDLKFIQNAKERRLKKQKDQAQKIFEKLSSGKDLKQKDLISDQQQVEQQKMEDEQQQSNQQKREGYRRLYGKNAQEYQNPHQSQKKKKTIEQQLKHYLLSGNNQSQFQQTNERNKILTKGINIQNLQSKYKPQKISIDLTSLIAQNKCIYQNYGNQALLENVKEFQREKVNEIQEQANVNLGLKTKKLKGWGSWIGPNRTQKKVDPKQQLQKKLKIIEQIKKKRQDSKLNNIIIHESHNKNLSQYFVKNLPAGYSNVNQFNFIQSQQVGLQWNSFNQFKDNIKPKVIMKVGQVIQPIKLPKKIQEFGKKKG